MPKSRESHPLLSDEQFANLPVLPAEQEELRQSGKNPQWMSDEQACRYRKYVEALYAEPTKKEQSNG